MDKDGALRDLKCIKSVFDTLGINFVLAYGTCLGIYRDNDFLPGDDDIDLAVVDELDLKTRKNIGWKLYDLGFQPQEILFNVFGRMEPAEIGYNGDRKTGIIVCQRNVKITIFFFGRKQKCDKHGEEYICIPKLGALTLIATPTRFYKEFDFVRFHKDTYFIPKPVEDYLAFSYKDWKDKTARDHSPTYGEAHPEYLEFMKNMTKTNEATIITKR